MSVCDNRFYNRFCGCTRGFNFAPKLYVPIIPDWHYAGNSRRNRTGRVPGGHPHWPAVVDSNAKISGTQLIHVNCQYNNNFM